MVDLKEKEDFTKEKLAEALAKAPEEMAFTSVEAAYSYHNMVLINGDNIYGRTVISFAEAWARLMEGEMLQGRKLDNEIIEQCSYLAAASYGVTGAGYGFARNLLVVHWKWGRELMSENQRDMYGDNPDMSQFYTSDNMVREKLGRRQ